MVLINLINDNELINEDYYKEMILLANEYCDKSFESVYNLKLINKLLRQCKVSNKMIDAYNLH